MTNKLSNPKRTTEPTEPSYREMRIRWESDRRRGTVRFTYNFGNKATLLSGFRPI